MKTKKIIVNTLTISRIVGAFILPLIFTKIKFTSLLILVSILFITDFLDGQLARKWKVQTMAGKILDPFGDKALAISCLLALIGTHIDFLVLLIFEISIMALNIYRTLHGENVSSTFIGKFKTWVLSITLIIGAIYLFDPEAINNILNYIGININFLTINENVILTSLVIAGVLETFTILSYIKETLKNKREQKYSKYELKPIKDILKRLFDEKSFLNDKELPLIEVLKK